jgi:hypothetical protein
VKDCVAVDPTVTFPNARLPVRPIILVGAWAGGVGAGADGWRGGRGAGPLHYSMRTPPLRRYSAL